MFIFRSDLVESELRARVERVGQWTLSEVS
jgi:hypothetical protein